MADKLTITGFSTALFSTWIFVEQLGLLLDAGDGVCAGLLQKSRKIQKVAITHPDRDHVTGILQLQQLNAQNGVPEIFYPADCGSFPALARFCQDFDPGRGDQVSWSPVKPGDSRVIGAGLSLKVIANDHFHDRPQLVKSVSYLVVRSNRKLKKEFSGMAQSKLAELSRERGADHITELVEEWLIGYSGDTSVASAPQWASCATLIHEATFLEHADAGDRTARHQHSVLGDVLRMAAEAQPRRLILNHFSSRYSQMEIASAIQAKAGDWKLSFPIFAIMPGEIARDILARPPVYAPA
jgi:ribonuclease Z